MNCALLCRVLLESNCSSHWLAQGLALVISWSRCSPLVPHHWFVLGLSLVTNCPAFNAKSRLGFGEHRNLTLSLACRSGGCHIRHSILSRVPLDPLASCSPYLPSYLSSFPPSVLPTLYTYIHFLPTFLSHSNAPMYIIYLPAPYLIFAFLDNLSPSPCYQHPPPQFYIYFHCISRLSTPCLTHPIPLPLPAPLPLFSLFWTIYECFIACISFPSYLYMYIYNY